MPQTALLEWLTHSKATAIFPHLLSWSLIFPLLFAINLSVCISLFNMLNKISIDKKHLFAIILLPATITWLIIGASKYPKVTVALFKTEIFWIKPMFRSCNPTSSQKLFTNGQDQNLCIIVSMLSVHLSHLYDCTMPIWCSNLFVAIILVNILYCNVWYAVDINLVFNLYTSAHSIWPISCSHPDSQVFLTFRYFLLIRIL